MGNKFEIYSNDEFAIQIENATAQLKDVTDKKTKDNIIFECSCSVQREIYNLFKKSVNDYMKKNSNKNGRL